MSRKKALTVQTPAVDVPASFYQYWQRVLNAGFYGADVLAECVQRFNAAGQPKNPARLISEFEDQLAITKFD